MNRDSSVEAFFCGIIIGAIIMSFLIALLDLTLKDGRDEERAAAIEAGVAEYIVNPKTGETTFQYIKPKKEEIK
jgi:hypothetical protein